MNESINYLLMHSNIESLSHKRFITLISIKNSMDCLNKIFYNYNNINLYLAYKS